MPQILIDKNYTFKVGDVIKEANKVDNRYYTYVILNIKTNVEYYEEVQLKCIDSHDKLQTGEEFYCSMADLRNSDFKSYWSDYLITDEAINILFGGK